MDLIELSGKRFIGIAQKDDYIYWAEDLLNNGVDSKNIAILASFSLDRNPYSEDIEFYFQKSLYDLKLELPEYKVGINAFGKYICNQIINSNISPQKGLDLLAMIYRGTDYHHDYSLYSIWYALDEDVLDLKYDGPAMFNSGLNKDNVNEYIKKVACQFLILLKMDLPDNFFNLHACQHCNNIQPAEFERIKLKWIPEWISKLIFRINPCYQSICKKCKLPFPKRMDDYEGREIFLEHYYRH